MKIKLLRTFLFIALLGAVASTASSCDNDDTSGVKKGTLHGVVTDELGISLPNVVVSVSGMDRTAVTKENGNYSIANVSLGEHTITYTKDGYFTFEKKVGSGDFDIRNNLELDISMQKDDGTITGTVTDKKTGEPIAGANVSSNGETVVTNGSGVYSFESFVRGDYTIEFSAVGYILATGEIEADDFVDKKVVFDMQMEPKAVISGIVTDSETDEAIPDVVVTMDDKTATTDADGAYAFKGLDEEDYILEFSKDGYISVTKEVAVGDFVDREVALNVELEPKSVISGTVLDMESGDPLQGVTVATDGKTATTDADGVYTFKGVDEKDYTLVFSKEEYVTLSENISAADFTDKLATVDVELELNSSTILGDMDADALANTRKWYHNVFQGGKNNEGGSAPGLYHWYWCVNTMSVTDYYGQVQEQNEGTTLQIRNDDANKSNRANMNKFDSFIYGSKTITADNKVMSLRIRTKDATEEAPAYYGVRVVDLSDADPKAVKIGETLTYGSDSYGDVNFDLSAYIGKEVVIAIGIYRAETGEDYYKQLVLRSVRFAAEVVEGTDWMPGTEIVEGWKLTKEMVASSMINPKTSFTGMYPVKGSDGGYFDAYRAWRGTSHIGESWSVVALYKEPDVFNDSGYSIKTNSSNSAMGTYAASAVPHDYIYSKFAITSAKNRLTLKARTDNSGSRADRQTYFKLSAVLDDGTFVHILPYDHTIVATDQYALKYYEGVDRNGVDTDGCVGFSNKMGSSSAPNDYATFVYDLSAYEGKNVTIVLGVYNIIPDTSENKVQIYSIVLDQKD